MRVRLGFRIGLSATLLTVGCAIVSGWVGCGAAGSAYSNFGSPFTDFVGSSAGGTNGTGSSSQTGGSLGGNDRTPVDPCTESDARKFIRISMRNETTDYIHYFFVCVAFVNGTTYPDGAVCAKDVALYESNGYLNIPDGQTQSFGNYCIVGPALVRFHDAGQFQGAGGASSGQLGSAIAPALGSSPTFDRFFTSAGAVLPVPDLILFHNPGTGDGAALKISRSFNSPCDTTTVSSVDSVCQQDAFYYVDERDQLAGSTALGAGSGRRVPSEIQGTGCQCLGTAVAGATLAPSKLSASNALCNEFFRGGHIEFVFIRDDENPPFPQCVWRVTDGSGALAHDFDPRSGVK